jgi:hypothetical protein
MFNPQDISFKDDSLHKKGNLLHIETFYYDAIFNNNYSVVALINILHLGNLGFVLYSLSTYKDTKLIKNKRWRIPYKNLDSSEEKPCIKIKDKQIIKGQIEKKSKNWIFNLNMGNNEHGIDLNLIKKSIGWKGKTYLGNWLVIPRFKINGKIFINGKKTDVSGEGYHDHNIYPFYVPFINKGYCFGKIFVDPFTITWARVMKKRNKFENIVVLNKNDRIVSVNPKYIQFTTENKIRIHGKKIPTKFCLNVDCDSLCLNVNMDSINFHHISIPTVKYWRHHVRNSGDIKVESFSKKIDSIEIVEYLKFL